MNGTERIRAAMEGREPDRTPVLLHNFLMAAREIRVSMREFRGHPEVIARAFIHTVETYEVDGVLVDVDTATLAGALGAEIAFPEDEPARCVGGSLDDLGRVYALEPPNIGAYDGVQVWLEAVRLLRRHFGDEVWIRGNCDQCPFSLASMVRGTSEWLMDLLDPTKTQDAHRLLAYCTEATNAFLRLMAEAGADMLSNGDSLAGPELVSPGIYREFALPYEKRVAAEARRLGLPHVLHICGDTRLILHDMVETGSDGLELDYKTDVALAHDLLKDRLTFLGNIDPSGVLARGTTADVERATRELVRRFSDTPRFILNAGCAIPAETPRENVLAMIQAARSA